MKNNLIKLTNEQNDLNDRLEKLNSVIQKLNDDYLLDLLILPIDLKKEVLNFINSLITREKEYTEQSLSEINIWIDSLIDDVINDERQNEDIF